MLSPAGHLAFLGGRLIYIFIEQHLEMKMKAFNFFNPTRILFGKDKAENLGAELKKDGIAKVLMIAGGGSIRQNGAYADFVKTMQEHKIDFVESWGVQANPTLEKARELIDLAKRENVQAIVAIGGGSVIDTAKAVAAGYYLDDIWAVYQRKAVIREALPLYTILTISATGSEMNGNAVLTNTETLQKWGIGSEKIYPRLSVIDPSYQRTLPPAQTVNGALDAIAHILEFYFMDPDACVTLGINDSLQCTIIEMTDRLLADPQDFSARASLAWAATLALNGLSGVGLAGGDWACHQIEHSFSALHPRIAHGAGLGVIFPAWIEFMAERQPAVFNRWAKNVWGASGISEAVMLFRDKIKAWGSPTNLRELGISESDIPLLVEKSMIAPRLGALSRFTASDVEALLMLAF